MIGDILAEPSASTRHECSRATARGRSVTRSPPRGRCQRDDRRHRPTRRSACPRAIRFGVGAEHRWCARRWRGHRARAALGLRCRDKGRRTRACPTDAARARQPRGAGRGRPSHSRDRYPGGCALRPGRPADGGRAGHRRGDPGSARQRPAGAPDRPGRAAFLPGQLQTMQGGADRLPAAAPAELLTDPANQTAQRPARRWIGSGYRRGCGGALGGTDRLAKAGLDLRAKGGPVR